MADQQKQDNLKDILNKFQQNKNNSLPNVSEDETNPLIQNMQNSVANNQSTQPVINNTAKTDTQLNPSAIPVNANSVNIVENIQNSGAPEQELNPQTNNQVSQHSTGQSAASIVDLQTVQEPMQNSPMPVEGENGNGDDPLKEQHRLLEVVRSENAESDIFLDKARGEMPTKGVRMFVEGKPVNPNQPFIPEVPQNSNMTGAALDKKEPKISNAQEVSIENKNELNNQALTSKTVIPDKNLVEETASNKQTEDNSGTTIVAYIIILILLLIITFLVIQYEDSIMSFFQEDLNNIL